jgi:AcrR family transcriptional regulator
MTPPGATAALRRVPKQARARQRLERVLDAAEAVFVEVGYEAATTNQIAARAGTSIGSLYEFFRDKQALAVALADRYVVDLGTIYNERIVDDVAKSGAELIDSIVDALGAFWRRRPATAALLRGALGAPELVAAGETLRLAFVDHITAVLAARRPAEETERCRFVAEITFDVTRSLLERAQAEPLHRRAAVQAELKSVLLAYLRTAMGHPPPRS